MLKVITTQFYDQLKGNTSIMFSEVGNAPAKIDQRNSERQVINLC